MIIQVSQQVKPDIWISTTTFVYSTPLEVLRYRGPDESLLHFLFKVANRRGPIEGDRPRLNDESDSCLFLIDAMVAFERAKSSSGEVLIGMWRVSTGRQRLREVIEIRFDIK